MTPMVVEKKQHLAISSRQFPCKRLCKEHKKNLQKAKLCPIRYKMD